MRAGWSYVGRRALFALITIFVAISLNFVLFRLAPGDRTSALRCQGCTEQFKQELKREYGLDKSIPEQYVIYLKATVTGDLGRSFVTEQPVTSELWTSIKNTVPMILLGTILIETVFNYPGIGLQIYQSVGDRDYPVLQGAFLLLTITVILMNFLADLLYFKLDPRVTE